METIACTLDSAAMRRRAATGAQLSARGLIDFDPTPSGYRLRFRTETKRDLEKLIAAESACCSFMKFELDNGPDEILLDVSAPHEGRPVIAQLFDLERRSRSRLAVG